MSLRNQLASTYATEGLKIVFAVAFGIISARALGPEGRGYVAAAWTAATIAVTTAKTVQSRQGSSHAAQARMAATNPDRQATDQRGSSVVEDIRQRTIG